MARSDKLLLASGVGLLPICYRSGAVTEPLTHGERKSFWEISPGDVTNGQFSRRLRGNPAASGLSPKLMSKTQGSAQVPLSVWLFGGRHAEPASRLDVSMAVIEAYTDPGDVVVDLLGTDTDVLGAATSSGRSVVVPTKAGKHLDAFAGLSAVADLVLAVPIGAPPRSCGAVYATAHELLRPGGLFVILPIASDPGVDPVSATVASAAEAGLDYFQHVVVLDPATSPGRTGDVSVTGNHINLLTFRRGR